MVFRAIGTFNTPLKYAILVCLQVIKKIGRLDFCVWFKRIVNHITSWSDIFIPVYLLDRALVTWFIIVDDGFQSTLGQVTSVIRNRPFCICGCYKLLKTFFYLVVRSSLLLRFHKPAFLQSACLLSADYGEGLCSHRPTFHGLDLWCRLRYIET